MEAGFEEGLVATVAEAVVQECAAVAPGAGEGGLDYGAVGGLGGLDDEGVVVNFVTHFSGEGEEGEGHGFYDGGGEKLVILQIIYWSGYTS